MIATTYQNVDEFLQTTQIFLEENEAANSLLLGICFQLKRFPDRIKTTPYFITVSAENELILAAIRTPPHNLVISGQGKAPDQALEILAQNLRSDHGAIPGMLGPSQTAQAFAETWAKTSKVEYRTGIRQRIYELRKVTFPQPTPGSLRLATEGEAELMTQWALAFQKEALTPGDPVETRETVERRISHQEIYLWEDGQPVSMAAKARPISNGISVNLVYTPPEFRRRGYATSCVAALSQILLDAGWHFCVLFTDLSNPTSNHIYQTIGYTPVCDFNEYVFDAAPMQIL
jgi:predicted GNAT family acetyltransferase